MSKIIKLNAFNLFHVTKNIFLNVCDANHCPEIRYYGEMQILKTALQSNSVQPFPFQKAKTKIPLTNFEMVGNIPLSRQQVMILYDMKLKQQMNNLPRKCRRAMRELKEMESSDGVDDRDDKIVILIQDKDRQIAVKHLSDMRRHARAT